MAASDVQREGENESRLRMERLASSRASEDDAGQASPRQSWMRRQATSLLAAGGLALGGAQPAPEAPADASGDVRRGAADVDRDVGAAARQQRYETQLNRNRRQEQAPAASRGKAPSPTDALALAKATPTGLAAGAAVDALTSKGLSTEEIQRGFGRGCILMLWNSLWLTFGHTIYAIAIFFYAAWASAYFRKFFPEVGEEWIPGPMLKKIPKPLLIPIKLAEIVAISFVLFWTFMLDMACIGLLALVLAAIMTAASIF